MTFIPVIPASCQKEQLKVWMSSLLLAHCVTDLTEDRVLTAFLLSPIMRSVTLFQVAFAWSSGGAQAEPKHKESGQNRWMFPCDSHITLCYFCLGFSPPWQWVLAVTVAFDNMFTQTRRLAENGKGTDLGDKNAFCWVWRQHGCDLGASSLQRGWWKIKETEIIARQKREGSSEGTIKFGRLNRTRWKRGQESKPGWMMFARTSAPFIVFTSHFSRFIFTPSFSHCLSSQSLSGVREMRTEADSSVRARMRAHTNLQAHSHSWGFTGIVIMEAQTFTLTDWLYFQTHKLIILYLEDSSYQII